MIKAFATGRVAHNNDPHTTTATSPFFAARGYDTLITVFPDIEVTDPRAKHVAINFDEIQKFLRERVNDAQDTMSKYANRSAWEAACTYIRTYVPTTYVRGRIIQTDCMLPMVNQRVPCLFLTASYKLAWRGFRPAIPLKPFTSRGIMLSPVAIACSLSVSS